MSYTLVLVGGTGQRFGLALGYLNLLGACTMPSQVVVIDAEGLGSAPNRVTRQMRDLLQFGEPNMRFIDHLPFYARDGGGDATIGNCIARLSESRLFPLCFSESEARTSIAQGFYAMPKLASVVYHAQLAQHQRETDGAFDHMPQQDGARRVIIVGSVSGGTGAGIIREVARRFRAENANQVIGIVFTRYLDLRASNAGPSNDDLDTNSRIGTGFLLDDTASPFDLITFVGPPDGQPYSEALDANQSALPHPFFGLLLACTLVTDGGDAYWERRATVRLNDRAERDEDVRLRHAFTVRKGAVSLTQDDIFFPLRATDAGIGPRYLRLSDAREAAALAQAELERWKDDYPLPAAVDGWSLFVRRKLTPTLHDTFGKERGTDRARRSEIVKMWGELTGSGGAIDVARAGLADFGTWLDGMAGSLKPCDGTNAWRTDWKDALQLQVGKEGVAQSFCRDVARAQWQSLRGPDARAQEPVYLYPYKRAAGGRVPIGMVEELGDVPAVPRVRDESYATPLARARAFARLLEDGDAGARQISQALWCGVALGWLALRTEDLKAGSDFERHVVAMNGDSHTRFTGLVSVADTPALPDALRRYRGQIVGATHWSCGLWPGLRKDALKALAEVSHALGPSEFEEARGVLALWRDDVLCRHAAIALRDQCWYEEVCRIVASNGTVVRPDHCEIRTIGPVRLSVDGQAAKLESIYLYTVEGNRAARLGELLQELGAHLSPTFAREDFHVAQAHVHVRRGLVHDGGQQVDGHSTIAGGFLDLEVTGLGKTSHVDPGMVLAGIGKLAVPTPVSDVWGLNGVPALRAPGPYLPDLFWQRSFEWKPDKSGEFVQLPLPAPNGAAPSAESFAPSLRGIRGLYFHPRRRKWIVWLKDEVYCPGGEDIVEDGPTQVKIRRGRRVWIVRFPHDGVLILKPEAVLLPELMLLEQDGGPDVAPALVIRREFLDLVVCEPDMSPAAMSDGSTYGFSFRLVGGVEVRALRSTQSAIRQSQLQIAAWPHVQSPAWRRFWVNVESDREAATKLDVRVYRRSEHGFFEEITERIDRVVGTSRFVSMIGRPRLMWLGVPGKIEHGGSFVVLGPEDPATATDTADVAIDFGTFRTAVSVKLGFLPESSPLPPDFKPLAVALVKNAARVQAARHNVLIPTLAGSPASPSSTGGPCAKLVVPSMLVAPRPGPDDGHTFLKPDAVPFVDYGVPVKGPRDSASLSEFPYSPAQNLKWGNTDEERAGRYAFLRSIVLLAAAEGYRRGASRLKIGFTYPLAYDDPAVLRIAMEQAIEWLNRSVLAPGAAELLLAVSESAAGMREARVAGAGWILSLDLGGGTLDLALFNGDQKNAKVLARDSVKLGGDLVTTSYAAKTNSDERLLRWQIAGGEHWLPKDKADALIREVDRLLLLSLEYAARFVAGMACSAGGTASIKLGVVLLGSGWRWYGAHRESGEFDRQTFANFYEKRFRERIEALSDGRVQLDGINTRVLDERLEKLAVSIGLLRLQPENQSDGSGIRAPNGLSDDGCAWDVVVGPDSDTQAGAPGGVVADPPFDDVLQERAPLHQHLTRDSIANNGILRSLRDAWDGVYRRRKRTALGVVFDQLAANEWFKR
jgi:hypothetical protein